MALASMAAAAYVGWRERSRVPLPAFEQLTFTRGRIGGARFASEGQSIVYSQAGEENHRDVWRLNLAEVNIKAVRAH